MVKVGIDGTTGTSFGALEPGTDEPPITGTDIVDSFSGSDGSSVNGRTPDTVTNGALWWASNTDIQSNQARVTAQSNGALIQVNTDEQDISLTFNAGGADNRMGISARRGSVQSAVPTDGYVFNLRPSVSEVQLNRYNGGSLTVLLNQPYSLDINTTYLLRFVVTTVSGNPVLTGYVDGNVAIGPYTDTNVNKILNGLYCGFVHFLFANSNARFDDFRATEFGEAQLTVNELTHAHEMPVVNVTKQLTISILDNPDSTEIGTWETVT